MWWGKVMGDILSRQSAWAFSSASRPTLPPMRKVSGVLPATAKSAMRRDSSSLEQVLPSMHMAITAPPRGSFSRMAAASVARAFWISAGEGSSGRRYSASSTISHLQWRCSRFKYSALASV